MMEIGTVIKAILSFIITIPVWLVLSAILSPFRTYQEMKNDGRWFNNKFVYHQPRHIFTYVVTPADHGKSISFSIDDAEPNTTVLLHAKVDGGLARIRITPQNLIINDDGISDYGIGFKGGVMIGRDKKAKIDISCPQDYSDHGIIRVYMDSWELQ